MDVDLTGTVAVVTGGGRGLGAAAARRFVAEGAQVIVFDLAVEEEIPDMRWIEVDVREVGAVRGAVDRVVGDYGGIDAVVNCAGVTGSLGPAHEVDIEDWQRTLDINLTGTFVVCAAVLGQMLACGSGRIVNFASAAGVEHQAGQASYNASKAGVISLTKTLAREVHASGVRVNAVCPAAVDTPLIREFIAQDLSGSSPELQANQRAHDEANAQGRDWDPDEVMDLVVMLVSEAGGHLSGQFIRMASKDQPGIYH